MMRKHDVIAGGQVSSAYWLALSLFGSTCATLAKETGITSFGVCLLYEISDIWWQYCRFVVHFVVF